MTIASLYGVSEDLRKRVKGKVTIHSNLLGQHYRIRDLILLSLPVLGPYLFRRYIPGTFDYLIIMHPAHLMASYTQIGTKSICWSHTDKDAAWVDLNKLSLLQKLKKYRLQLCYKNTNATWVVTDSIRDAMCKAFNTSNIYTLDNPIDCQEIVSKAYALDPPEMDPGFFLLRNGRKIESRERTYSSPPCV